MRSLLILLVPLLLIGCSSKSAKVEFSCLSEVQAGIIVTNCADPDTWRKRAQ